MNRGLTGGAVCQYNSIWESYTEAGIDPWSQR